VQRVSLLCSDYGIFQSYGGATHVGRVPALSATRNCRATLKSTTFTSRLTPFARRLAKAKKLVEAAIEEGSKMKRPNCGLAGRKDDVCTHMTCLRCTAVWCYVCGLDVNQCNKAQPRDGRPADDILLHNQGWEVNPKRCPMYLTHTTRSGHALVGQKLARDDC
jgi:hypothetical protein